MPQPHRAPIKLPLVTAPAPYPTRSLCKSDLQAAASRTAPGSLRRYASTSSRADQLPLVTDPAPCPYPLALQIRDLQAAASRTTPGSLRRYASTSSRADHAAASDGAAACASPLPL